MTGTAQETAQGTTGKAQRISIVIPAYNEERGIRRLLAGLMADAAPDEFDVVVVCNGCTDDTARVAAAQRPAVRVIETPDADKYKALRVGDQHSDLFPRVYVDADIEVTASDIRALAATSALAAAPERRMALTGCSWTVRWFYEVWLRLPGVREGLYARGAIALSEEGWRRIADLPPLMGDDLVMSALFEPGERQVVPGAVAVIHPSRTWGDLIRRRVRAMTAAAQFESAVEAPRTPIRTGKADLLGVLRADPRLAPQVLLFVVVAVVARRKARRAIRTGDFTTWLRDNSSRDA